MAPAKSLPMQAFMLYMSGGGVQIFSMGIVFMLLSSPFKNVASMNTSACLPSVSALSDTQIDSGYSVRPICPLTIWFCKVDIKL